jgi:cell division protein FtsL
VTDGAAALDPAILPEGWALALPAPHEHVESHGRTEPSDPTERDERSAPSARTPAARPRTDRASRARRRAHRGLHPTFMVFATVVIVALVLGVVAMNALFAQTAFAVHATQTRVTELAEQNDVLATDVARLSSPSRIAAWAERYHMVLPDDVVILRVPRFGRVSSESP